MSTLDPILAGALQLEQLAIVPGRTWAVTEAQGLTSSLERIATQASIERDHHSSQQLLNVAEAIAVMVVSLVAYSRGRVPKVSSGKPKINIVS